MKTRKLLGTVGLWLVAVCAYGQQVQLDTLRVQYVDFQGKKQCGELICNKVIASDLREIFEELYKAKYPIEPIRSTTPVSDARKTAPCSFSLRQASPMWTVARSSNTR